jgi:hypothetical protein
MIPAAAEIESLALEFTSLTADINKAEELIKGARAAVKAETGPWEDQLAEWKERKQQIADLLLPAWIEMAELHKVNYLAGIELRRGKTPKPILPPKESDDYRQLALSLLDYTTADGKPLVELTIKVRELERHAKDAGVWPDGVELGYSDTLAVKGG